MRISLKNLSVRGRARRPSASRPACLQVEALEGRLALSATPSVPLPPPLVTFVAPVVTQNTADGGVDVVEPNRCVHGYKWRPRPFDSTGTAAPFGLMQREPSIASQRLSFVAGETAHLVKGGADGVTVVISSNGHVVPPPSPGPWLDALQSRLGQ
jgi:hypothetical protein